MLFNELLFRDWEFGSIDEVGQRVAVKNAKGDQLMIKVLKVDSVFTGSQTEDPFSLPRERAERFSGMVELVLRQPAEGIDYFELLVLREFLEFLDRLIAEGDLKHIESSLRCYFKSDLRDNNAIQILIRACSSGLGSF